jgi:hypothetical protein
MEISLNTNMSKGTPKIAATYGKRLGYEVVKCSNAGEQNSMPCSTLADAKRSAKQCRTLDNQTVKIRDAFGSLYHWSRVMGAKGNRWTARGVVNDVFLSPE